MDSPPGSPLVISASPSPPQEVFVQDAGDGFITLQEWRGWGSVSPFPAMVGKIVHDLKSLEKNVDAQMSFGGNGGKLQVFYPIKTSNSSLFINFVAGMDKMYKATYICFFASKVYFFHNVVRILIEVCVVRYIAGITFPLFWSENDINHRVAFFSCRHFSSQANLCIKGMAMIS